MLRPIEAFSSTASFTPSLSLHTFGTGVDISGLRSYPIQKKTRYVGFPVVLVGHREGLYAASARGELYSVEDRIDVARVTPNLHIRKVEERLVELGFVVLSLCLTYILAKITSKTL